MSDTQQISFSQYIDGVSLQISKMLHKISEVATALEAELQEKTKSLESTEILLCQMGEKDVERENELTSLYDELAEKCGKDLNAILDRPKSKPTKKK